MSDAELAGARVRQLLDLTRRLTERLAAETRAFQEGRPQEVAKGLAETQEMIRAARNCRLPQVVIAFRSDMNGDSESGVVPVLKGRTSKEGKPLAYLCIDQVCQVPFENVEELTLRLSELEKRSESPSAQSSGKESGE